MNRFVILLALTAMVVAGCEQGPVFTEPQTATLDEELRRSLAGWGVVPIGAMPAQNPAQVELGRVLFFDPVLSGNRDIACATCHLPATALADALPLSIGTGGSGSGANRRLGAGRQFVQRSSPTLLNAGLGMPYLFWDGRLARFEGPGPGLPVVPPTANREELLVAQAMATVLNRREMLGNPGDKDVAGNPNELALLTGDAEVWQGIMKRLLAIPEYMSMFTAAFPGRPQSTLRFEDAALALAMFERQAFTKTNSPFDHYLERDNNALTPEQKRGARLFFGEGQCGSCHSGPFLGGQSFANVGAPQIGPGGRADPPRDLGRGEFQESPFYRFAFRVPPLRNVELTSPYMHSGAYATLEAVVRHYDDVEKAVLTYDVDQHAPTLRHLYLGDSGTKAAVLSTLDQRLRTPLQLTEAQIGELLAFLRSLTDPGARDLGGIAPGRVPSGLPVAPL